MFVCQQPECKCLFIFKQGVVKCSRLRSPVGARCEPCKQSFKTAGVEPRPLGKTDQIFQPAFARARLVTKAFDQHRLTKVFGQLREYKCLFVNNRKINVCLFLDRALSSAVGCGVPSGRVVRHANRALKTSGVEHPGL